MSDFSFKPYQDAIDAYDREIEQLERAYEQEKRQLQPIGDRLVANARGIRNERGTKISILGKLKTIEAQMDKWRVAMEAARDKYNADFEAASKKFRAAIDREDERHVHKIQRLCGLAGVNGRGTAGTHYLLEETKTYDRAKGDYKLRHALHGQILDLLCSVVESAEPKSSPSEPEILKQLDAISDPEERSRFYSKNQAEILSAYEARQRKP